MKKFPIMSILLRDENYDFTIQAKEPGDELMTTIVTSEQFKTKLRQKYYDFNFITGSFDDPELGTVEFANNITQAVDLFNKAFNVWRDDRKQGLLKLLNALRSKYDPIWNVDGTETETIIRDLDTTNSGQKQNTGTQTNTDTGTETKTNTGTSANAKTGTEGTQGTSGTVTQNSPYDDNLFYNKEKDDVTNNETTTYNTTDTRTDNLSEQVSKSLQNQRTDNLSESESGTGTEDETTTRTLKRQGNIGVTKTQDLLLSQFNITEYDKLIDYIVQLFIVENCVI